MGAERFIEANRIIHDRIANRYESDHAEIFNEHEQQRLIGALTMARDAVITDSSVLRALDVGCGSGNLTKRLQQIGFSVTASDISVAFLQKVGANYGVETHLLSGTGLEGVPDDTYDMVAAYSVLHHIPDYIGMVEEMCRVLKPGGILYIDHERNERFWNQVPELQEFYRSQRYRLLFKNLPKLLSPIWYLHRFRRIMNPRYQAEGDIHVFPDDHIDWDAVGDACVRQGVPLLYASDYLMYDARFERETYAAYALRTDDMRASAFRKGRA